MALNLLNKKIERVPVGRLNEYDRNPRRGNEDLIDESLDALGFYGVVIAQESTGLILAGNHRFRRAVGKGLAEVDVAWVDVDDATALRLVTADNRTSDSAGYDQALLVQILNDLAVSDAGLGGTGYTEDDLGKLVQGLAFTPEAAPTVNVGEALNISLADVRQVQLFYTGADLERFALLVEELAPALGTETPSATVLAALARLTEDVAAQQAVPDQAA